MKYFRSSLLWVLDHLVGTYIALLLVGGGLLAHAQLSTSYEVADESQMFLDVSITATQTTGIILAAPQRNGVSITMATKTGGVLRLRQGSRLEDISYTSATVNTTTFKVTLAGVTRNICPGVFKTFVTCGAGQAFSKGAIVELTVDARLLNLKANIDRKNNFTGSGGISFSNSGSFTQPYFSTTAIRDTQLGTNPRRGSVSCTDDTGQCYDYLAGAWRSRSGSNIANATQSAAGKVQLATVANQLAKTVSDAGPVVLQARYLTSSGGSALAASRVPIMGAAGLLSGSLLGTGTRSTTTFLRGDQTYAAPAASGSNIIINQTDQTAPTLSSATFVAVSGNLGASQTFVVGDLLQVIFRASGRRLTGDPKKIVFDIQVGNNPVSPSGSGAISFTLDSGLSTSTGINYGFTLFHRVLTGGSLTVQPVYRTYDTAGGANVLLERPAHFQVIKVEN